MIDINGKVILENEYTYISEDFIDGVIFARGSDRKYYLISVDGSKEEINYPNISLLHNGIIFSASQIDDIFRFTFLNLKKEKLVEYDSSTLSFTKINISNAYGDFEVYYMNDSDKKIVVHNITSR